MCISQRGVMEFDNSDDVGEIIITLPPPFQSIQLPTHKWRYMIGKQPSLIYCFEVIQSKDGLVNEIRKRARIDMETKTIGIRFRFSVAAWLDCLLRFWLGYFIVVLERVDIQPFQLDELAASWVEVHHV